MPTSASVAHHRAKIGALSRSRRPDDPELVDARRSLAAERITEHIEKILAEAPPLSDEQRTKLAELLRPARRNGGAA